jgi:hypothetical protein
VEACSSSAGATGGTQRRRPQSDELADRVKKLPSFGLLAASSAALLCSALLLFPLRVAAAPRVAATTGFVTANGTQLSVRGKPWKFAGYNLPCANPERLVQDGSLDYYLNDIQQNSGANLVRVWFFQSEGGPGNWTDFDTVISALKARGMRAIVTLAGSTSTCDEPNAPTLYKTLGWYQNGYMSPYGGYNLSFHDYAVDVAAHYANEPTVAFWQLINEAQAPSYNAAGNLTCPNELAARDALRGFSDTMAAAIRTADPHHLVDLGTLTTGDCGIANDADYTYVHGGLLDLCEFHDYGFPASPMPAALAGIVTDCRSLHKPVFVGESGIPSDVGPDGTSPPPSPDCVAPPCPTLDSLAQRASFFQAKIRAANTAGIAGYVIWVKSPYYDAHTDTYDIPDGDPTELVLSQALEPYLTAPALVPEAPCAVALVGMAVAVLGAGWWWCRRGPVHVSAPQ